MRSCNSTGSEFSNVARCGRLVIQRRSSMARLVGGFRPSNSAAGCVPSISLSPVSRTLATCRRLRRAYAVLRRSVAGCVAVCKVKWRRISRDHYSDLGPARTRTRRPGRTWRQAFATLAGHRRMHKFLPGCDPNRLALLP